METESATARTEPRGAAPSGKVSSTATCCPEVATFDGARTPDRVRGFDARTNLVNNRGSEEYWLPPAKAKAAPSDPYTQDGAAWASVGLGETTELEIAFEGHSGNGCLLNCSFEPDPAGIVELLDQKIAANNAAFRLRGLAEGETTIKVMCNGAELGWVHVVCYKLIEVRAVAGWIDAPFTRPVSYNAGALQSFLNRVYKQALIRFKVIDIGRIDLGASGDLASLVGDYAFNLKDIGQTRYIDGFGEVDGDVIFAGGANDAGEEFILAKDIAPFVEAYPGIDDDRVLPLVYFVHATHLPEANGSVPEVGRGPAFAYKDYSDTTVGSWGIEDSYAVLAHEAGHAFGLYHPNDPHCAELPGHLRASCGQPVSAEPATNTEPAIAPEGKDVSVERSRVVIMARDPLNLMGYWPEFTEATFLRKGQWDRCRSGAMKYKGRT
ncbi:hypothetical protein ACFOMH_06555 [Paracoccus mangrovi]|uniref:Peptidase M11 gametolysin domain-containing protein n=1 Tax=Paracoccus mangrovi TaxID=1715645 RepID=A0ABV7R2S5_9RHOB